MMFRYFALNNLKHGVKIQLQKEFIDHILISRPLSTNSSKSTTSHNIRHYIKNMGYLLGAGITVSLIYSIYETIAKVPVCPNFNRKQNINIDNILACTSLIKTTNEQCTGKTPMKKIGAITGINYKLAQVQSDNSNTFSRILLNDEDLCQKNLFDMNYKSEYVNTLADLLFKLDEPRRIKLLCNKIGYYVFICPECHSSLTKQMISCTSYLHSAGLRHNPVNVSEIENEKTR